MMAFLLRRVAAALLLVLLVSSAAMVLARLAPGDEAAIGSNPAIAAAERHRLGYDRPLLEQYTAWLARGIHPDFG